VIQPGVARITEPRLGTAFAIDFQTALTAWHCVRDPYDDSKAVDDVELEFLGDEFVHAEVGPGDPTEDWATLAFTTPLPESLRPIPLRRDVQPWDECRCLGFPRAAAEVGYLPILATVSGETHRAGVPVLTLEADTAGRGLDVRGLSGGPVVPRRSPDEAVGLVSRRLMDFSLEEQVGGVLFACPARLFADAPVVAPPELRATEQPSGEDLAAAARGGDVSAAARVGHRLLAEGNATEAEPWLRQAARGGDAAAAYAVGMLIDPDGTLLERDPALAHEALAWFRRAATGGDVYGATTMGIRLHQHKRDDAALPWLQEAVERGADAMAAHTLARIYEQRGDLAQAEYWERFAAKRGDVRAAYDLGRILNARGDQRQAIPWLERATVDPDAVELLRELGVEPG
jgi:hypothetical protein